MSLANETLDRRGDHLVPRRGDWQGPAPVLKPDVSPILRSPRTGKLLTVDAKREALIGGDGEVFPIVRGVPRFVDSEKYVGSFGIEWNRFPHTQLDSANGTGISHYRFEQLTGEKPEAYRGKRVLEAGCGMGRFIDVLAEAGAEVWGADLSAAVEAGSKNTAERTNCQVVQADLFELPFGEDFDLVYSFGVIHHTPDPEAALKAIARHLKPGGKLIVWVYSMGLRSGIKARWVPRPHQVYGHFFRSLPTSMWETALSTYTKGALAVRDSGLPLVPDLADWVLPIQDLRRRSSHQDGYEPQGDTEAREALRWDWALHSAYDQFTPTYTRQQSNAEVLRWAERAGLRVIGNGPIPATVIAEKPL